MHWEQMTDEAGQVSIPQVGIRIIGLTDNLVKAASSWRMQTPLPTEVTEGAEGLYLTEHVLRLV